MVLWEPVRRRLVGDVVDPERCRLTNKASEQSMSARQRADLGDRFVVDPDVDELREFVALLVDHAECAVSCADELATRLDDLPEQLGKADVARERHQRVEQAAQPVLRRGHLLRALDHLTQQVVQMHPGWCGPDSPTPGSVTPGSRSREPGGEDRSLGSALHA